MGKTLREKFNELNRYCEIHHCCDCPLKEKHCIWYEADYGRHVDEDSFVKAIEEHHFILFSEEEEETTPPPTLLKVDEIEEVSGLEMATIALTKSEVDNLIDFFDTDFIQTIRDDEGIDNMGYLCDMCSIYKKLEDAQAELDI